jgi:hypothetical protein
MKTYKNWKGNLENYLQPGDVVDEEMVNYFIDVLPPAYMNSNLVQMGEPYSHVNGKATYSTVYRKDGNWIYAGHCHVGKIEHLEGR